MSWLRRKVSAACLSGAVLLVGAKYFAPDLFDPFLDAANVALVWISIKIR